MNKNVSYDGERHCCLFSAHGDVRVGQDKVWSFLAAGEETTTGSVVEKDECGMKSDAAGRGR